MAIIGAGLPGLAAATLLRRNLNCRVTVFEQHADADDADRRAAFVHGSRVYVTPSTSTETRALLRLTAVPTGMRRALESCDIGYRRHIVETRPATYLDWDAVDMFSDADREYRAERAPQIVARAIAADLRQRIDDDALRVRYGVRVAADDLVVNRDRTISVLGDDYDLLLGCDGRRSIVRPLVTPLQQAERDPSMRRVIFDVPVAACEDAVSEDIGFVGSKMVVHVSLLEHDGQDRLRVTMTFPIGSAAALGDPIDAFRKRVKMSQSAVLRGIPDHVDNRTRVEVHNLVDRDWPVMTSTFYWPIALLGDALRQMVPYHDELSSLALEDAVQVCNAYRQSSRRDVHEYWQAVEPPARVWIEQARSNMEFMHAKAATDKLVELHGALLECAESPRNV